MGKSRCIRESLQDVITFFTHTRTHTLVVMLTAGLISQSSKSFSAGQIRAGLADFIPPSALYFVFDGWLEVRQEEIEWTVTLQLFKTIALYPRSNFCSQNDQRQTWEFQLFQSESTRTISKPTVNLPWKENKTGPLVETLCLCLTLGLLPNPMMMIIIMSLAGKSAGHITHFVKWWNLNCKYDLWSPFLAPVFHGLTLTFGVRSLLKAQMSLQ